MTTQRRDKILQAALQLFVEQGFRGTSTSGIAKKAGVATGTLFHHFKNKEELIAELYLSAKFKLSQHLSESLATADDLAGQFRALWFASVEWAITHDDQYRFFKHCEATPYISENLRQQGEARFAFVFELFTQVAANRKNDDISPILLFDLYVGMVHGFINHLLKYPEARANRDLWEKAFVLCWEAISR